MKFGEAVLQGYAIVFGAYPKRLSTPLPINLEDIPEICFPQYLMAAEPPEDAGELMIEVDQWAAEQCIDDADRKPHGLAWLALSELVRYEHCENYFGACEDRDQVAREE